MDALKRIVAGALVALVAAATAVRPACALTCERTTDRAVATRPAPTGNALASHCAHMGHGSPAASARVAATDAHPCGAHVAIAADDARLTRVDPGVALPALVDAAASIAVSALASRHIDARPFRLPPPGPPRAPLVLRL